MAQVTYDYGTINPSRDIVFARGMLPYIGGVSQGISVAATRLMRKSTRTWPKWLMYAMTDTKRMADEITFLMDGGKSAAERHDYVFVVRAIERAKDTSLALVHLLESENPDG